MYKEAFYYSISDGKANCTLCPNNCVIAEGKTGKCGSRTLRNGVLLAATYGNPCALQIDPMEKKPLYHFHPASSVFSIATSGCNFSCLNCQNYTISQKRSEKADEIRLSPKDVIKYCLEKKCKTIAYTYTEPTVYYEYMLDIAKLARENNIKNVFISNGYINSRPLTELCQYLDAANIDLKCFDEKIYKKLCGGSLSAVLNTLKTLKKNGVWLEITNLIIPSWTDNMDMIRMMCQWLVNNGFAETPLHFSRFSPTYKLDNLISTPLKTLEDAAGIAFECGINYVYLGNVLNHSFDHTYCPQCKQVLLERAGFSVLSNHIVNGNCKFCNHKITGIWD